MISHLAFVIDSCLFLGYFLKSLKHALMIFIPKSTLTQHDVENCRPISLLEIHGKILDEILNTRLNQHLTLHDLHTDSGDVEGPGTSFQILLGGGGGQMPSPSKIEFLYVFFIEYLSAFFFNF